MEPYHMLFAATDMEYVRRFCVQAEKKSGGRVVCRGYPAEAVGMRITGPEEEAAQIVLIEEALWNGLAPGTRAVLQKAQAVLCLLTEEQRGTGETDPGQPVRIYRYQRTEEILREAELALGVTRKEPGEAGEERGAEILAVYSPAGYPSLTAVSELLAEICGERARVLLVSLTEYAGEAETATEKGLSELIYLFRTGAAVPEAFDQEYTDLAGGIHRLRPCSRSADLRELTSEEAAGLLVRLAGAGFYERVIAAVGPGRDPAPIAAVCRRMLIPLSGSAGEAEVLEVFLQEEAENAAGRAEAALIPPPQNGNGRSLLYTACGKALREWLYSKGPGQVLHTE